MDHLMLYARGHARGGYTAILPVAGRPEFIEGMGIKA
jgi:hypothetical protein